MPKQGIRQTNGTFGKVKKWIKITFRKVFLLYLQQNQKFFYG